jgi:hypothetical protein
MHKITTSGEYCEHRQMALTEHLFPVYNGHRQRVSKTPHRTRRQPLVAESLRKYDMSNSNSSSVFLLIAWQITPHAGINNGMRTSTHMTGNLAQH